MARADLLIQLVHSGIKGDKISFKKTVEAIIAEERSKQHKALAGKLEGMLQNMSINSTYANTNGISQVSNKRIDNLL